MTFLILENENRNLICISNLRKDISRASNLCARRLSGRCEAASEQEVKTFKCSVSRKEEVETAHCKYLN